MVCIITGIIKGLFDSVLHLIGSGLAILASVFLAKYVANFLNKLFNFEDWFLSKLDGGREGTFDLFGKIRLDNVELAKFTTWIVSVVIVFLVVKLVLLILTKVFESATSKSRTLSGINRVLGMVFGIVRGGVIAIACLAVCSLIANIPVIGDPIYKEVTNAKITGAVFKYVDDFIEKNITEEKVKDIINRIVSDNESTPTEPESEGGNVVSSPYICINYVEDTTTQISQISNN